ncbi:aminoacetone oxidase family FAD-binding enzyme, partial [bacterium]|nr:aminoacetone oxidase family FAD-binding enzyme [bacterium]
RYAADKVILAAGGSSAPNLGSNGTGFRIAAALGHQLIEPFPALVQLCLEESFLKTVKGLKIDGRVQVHVNGRPKRAETGEILFADYGISGPPVLDVSRDASEGLQKGQPVEISLDQFPQWTAAELTGKIKRRFEIAPHKTAEFALVGFLHKRLIPVVLKSTGVPNLHVPCGSLTEEQVRSIAIFLKDWRMPCTATQSWMYSQVTAGGVDTREVDARTLESRRVPGVYLAGEVLDVDGDCGGFNLQWAWTSGHITGEEAATAL